MKKQLFVALALTAIVSQQSFGAEMSMDAQEMPLVTGKWSGAPMFESNYIKMATSPIYCGGVTLMPRSGLSVQVVSQLFTPRGLTSKLFGGKIAYKPSKNTLSKGYVEVDPWGMRVRYNHPGVREQYRVFCRVKDQRGNWNNVDCYKVLTLDDVRHNKPCIYGARASYAPLNMNK